MNWGKYGINSSLCSQDPEKLHPFVTVKHNNIVIPYQCQEEIRNSIFFVDYSKHGITVHYTKYHSFYALNNNKDLEKFKMKMKLSSVPGGWSDFENSHKDLFDGFFSMLGLEKKGITHTN